MANLSVPLLRGFNQESLQYYHRIPGTTPAMSVTRKCCVSAQAIASSSRSVLRPTSTSLPHTRSRKRTVQHRFNSTAAPVAAATNASASSSKICAVPFKQDPVQASQRLLVNGLVATGELGVLIWRIHDASGQLSTVNGQETGLHSRIERSCDSRTQLTSQGRSKT